MNILIMPVINRKNIKGEVTFQPPEFYNNTYWNATFNRLNDGGFLLFFQI